jgi:hypothetical protein
MVLQEINPSKSRFLLFDEYQKGGRRVKRGKTFLRQCGASMVELLIALPMFVLLIFIIAEFGLMYQAKSVLNVAALAAARSGAIHGGNTDKMKAAAALALTPLYTNEANTSGLIGGVFRSKLDTALPHAVGTTDLIRNPLGPTFNGIGSGMQMGLTVDILSPTPRMVEDFGVMRAYLSGSDSAHTERVIPNDNLMYRSTTPINDVNVQDANLLKIRVSYLYALKMPLTHYFFTPLMNANLTGVLFGGEAAGNTAAGDFRVRLVSYATVRMQSDFREASLDSGNGGGSSSGGGTGAGNGELSIAAPSSPSSVPGGGEGGTGTGAGDVSLCNPLGEEPGYGCEGGEQ